MTNTLSAEFDLKVVKVKISQCLAFIDKKYHYS